MIDKDGLVLSLNEDGVWGIKEEPYCTIEVATKEDYEGLQKALEKQIPRKTKYKTTCPVCNTYNSVWNKRTNTKPGDIVYCWHCGNAIKLDWRVEE